MFNTKGETNNMRGKEYSRLGKEVENRWQ